MKLVEGAKLLGREPLILRSEGRQRRLQPLGQAGRAIVVAHVIKDIGHCKVPLSLPAVVADLQLVDVEMPDAGDRVSRSRVAMARIAST